MQTNNHSFSDHQRIAAAVFFVGAFAVYIITKACGADVLGYHYAGACVIFGFAMLLPDFLSSGQNFLLSVLFIMVGAFGMLWLDVLNILSRVANALNDAHVVSGRMITLKHWLGWLILLTFCKLLFGDFGMGFKDKPLETETAQSAH